MPAGLAPDALDSLRLDAEGAPGIRLGVGEPASGVPGFAVTHSEAQEARRVATLAAEAPGSVTRYGRVAVQALASVDADQARRLVRRRLGGLASEDETSTRLATTLRTYLEEQASRSRAARRLGVHENTVSYRIRQAEEILGRSVERDTLELHVALALAPLSRRTDG
ncbi:MAG: helix-turn-helix domain-containing protein [Solirubrobacteraceae bacterium]